MDDPERLPADFMHSVSLMGSGLSRLIKGQVLQNKKATRADLYEVEQGAGDYCSLIYMYVHTYISVQRTLHKHSIKLQKITFVQTPVQIPVRMHVQMHDVYVMMFCLPGRFPGWTDGRGKGPWEVADPTRLLTELNRAQFPPDIGLRVRSCAALQSKQKVHGAEKMADQINLLSTGLIKVMASTLPPLQRVAIGKISDACAGFWEVQFTVGEGKRYEKLMIEGLCLLERGFPSYQIHTTIFHYCVHIASHWRKFGPPRLCNCFVFERHIGAMVSTIQSRGLYVASGLLIQCGAHII